MSDFSQAVGQLPAGWKWVALKRCGNLEGGSGFPTDEQGLSIENANIPFFKVKDLCNERYLETTDNYITEQTAQQLRASIFPPMTIVFAKVGAALLLNRFRILKTAACIDNNMMSLRLIENMNPTFFMHTLSNNDMAQNFNQGPVPSINTKQISYLPIPLPPLPEQRRIAAFLDKSCAAIDSAIAAKQQQIQVLEQAKKDLAFKLVTQGVNAGVAMQATSLDWLPIAPAHWKVQHIKRRCQLLRGKFTHRPRNDPALYDGPYPFIQTGDVTATPKYITTYSQTLNELGYEASKEFPAGTLVMTIAANIGDVAILQFNACFPDSMVGLIPDHNTDLEFLFYLMRSIKPIMLRSAVISTQLNLNYVRIGTNYAAFPPKEEQKQIVEAIIKREKEWDILIETISRQIATLQAYRKSIIHECVTGQRRVAEDVDLDTAGAQQ